MVFAYLAALLIAVPPTPKTCAVDTEKMLALDVDAFDQDLVGGWRPLALRPECEEAAANLLALYQQRHPRASYLLPWHEGQIRLGLGQTKRAIPLLENSRRAPPPKGKDTGWNFYVDATLAFARGDLKALKTARARLAALRKPAEFPTTIKWPMNLEVVDGLINCFGRPYNDAYDLACRSKKRK